MIRILRIVKLVLVRRSAAFYYSFPIQLFFSQLRNHKILLAFWLVFIALFTGKLGSSLGGAYLFLNPEFMGRVNMMSTFILGITFGIFITSYNLNAYILDGLHYNFIFFIARPFLRFSMNNVIMPLTFLGLYSYCFIDFQVHNAGQSMYDTLLELGSLYVGTSLAIIFTTIYFFNTEKDIFKLFGAQLEKKMGLRKLKMSKLTQTIIEQRTQTEIELGLRTRVDNYFAFPHKIRKVIQNYSIEYSKVKSILNENQVNATYVLITMIVLIIVLGLLKDSPYFQIPASASVILLASTFMMLSGSLTFWFRKIGGVSLLLLFILLFFVNKMDWYTHSNKAFGLNYDNTSTEYSYDKMNALTSEKIVYEDLKDGIKQLNNWKAKFADNSRAEKPKIIFVNTTGGGLRSAVWTLKSLLHTDSILQGELGEHIMLITGASGGMIGATYYRELLIERNDDSLFAQNTKYIQCLSRDLLNRIFFNISTTLFLPDQKFSVGRHKYDQDRGYSFEQQLMENTQMFFDKNISDYTEIEQSGKVPMIVFTPTIVNDGRKLFISSQKISYLIKPHSFNSLYSNESSGIEFSRFFEAQESDKLLMTTAIRMNATFPYISPNIQLPSEPIIEVMDAGIADNFGTETTIRFLFAFKDWISKNTSGVVILQIRDTPQLEPIERAASSTLFQKFFNPIGGFYNSIVENKDYKDDELMEYAAHWFKGQMDIIQFQYIPQNGADAASLSWHLTPKEKANILNSISHQENVQAIAVLRELLESNPSKKEKDK